jgi:hypothetical protein
MGMKKYLPILLVIILLFGIFSGSGFASPPDKSEMEFRKSSGFLTNNETIQRAIKDSANNNSKQSYGVRLTDDEIKELIYRQKISDDSIIIKDTVQSYGKSKYAGMFMNPTTGMLNVGVVGDDNEFKKNILAIFPHKNRITFFDAKFSYEELLV